jgi:hypothetical protein
MSLSQSRGGASVGVVHAALHVVEFADDVLHVCDMPQCLTLLALGGQCTGGSCVAGMVAHPLRTMKAHS